MRRFAELETGRTIIGIILMIAISVACLAAFYDFFKGAPSPKEQAWKAAMKEVRSQLKCPSEASFGEGTDEAQDPNSSVREVSPHRYNVSGWVDAQNSFGAKPRLLFTVKLLHEDDNWITEDVSIAE